MKEPITVEYDLMDGQHKVYKIRQFPATECLRFVTLYPESIALSGTKVGNYNISEKLMVEMMAYVSVVCEGGLEVPLSTIDMINNHCDFNVLQSLIREMFDFNTGFFTEGKVWSFLNQVIKGLTDSLIEMSKN